MTQGSNHDVIEKANPVPIIDRLFKSQRRLALEERLFNKAKAEGFGMTRECRDL
jgi:hypothetical protein